jgi:hypothetical protein
MTDSPETPRTEAGRDWLRWKYGGRTTGRDYDEDLTRILTIEREAASTDAWIDAEKGSAALAASDAEVESALRALAASDAGEAWVESVVGEPGMYASDAGPAGIDVERLARAMDSYDPPPMFKDGMKIRSAWSRANSSDAPLIAAEYDRLSHESDR